MQTVNVFNVKGMNDFFLAPKMGLKGTSKEVYYQNAIVGFEIKRTIAFCKDCFQPQVELLMCGAQSNKPFFQVRRPQYLFACEVQPFSETKLAPRSFQPVLTPRDQVITNLETFAVIFYYNKATKTIKNRHIPNQTSWQTRSKTRRWSGDSD